MAEIKQILSYLLSVIQIIVPIGAQFFVGEDAFFTEWSVTDEFGADDYIAIEKDPDEDFVVLNLADVQLKDNVVYGTAGEYTEVMVEKLIEEKKPDLITLTGDNAWGTAAYLRLVKMMEAYEIPWAPVMGNHDGQGCANEFWAAYHLYKAEHCLFEFGPKDMGYGNYIINITENGRIIHTLFMMDTHNGVTFTDSSGTQVSGYDGLWNNQIEWYKWAVKGIEKIEGKPVESTVFIHIPLPEYEAAWSEAYNEDEGSFNPDYAVDSFGGKREAVSCSVQNNGFFSVCKELGSTKNVVAGHDHVNNFSVVYQGIRLSYALKTGYGAYYDEDMAGASTVTVNKAGNAVVEHNFVDKASLQPRSIPLINIF